MKKKMRDFSPPILEAWATWEILRKLQFASDDIFWVFGFTANAVPAPGVALNIVLRSQGKELTATCSNTMSEKEARRMEADSRTFQELLAADKFDEAEMTRLLHASYAWKNKADLIVALSLKGFRFPYKMN